MTRFRNFMARLVLSAYMPRSVKVVLLTMIGLGIAAIVLGAVEQVSSSHEVVPHHLCVPIVDCSFPMLA